MQLIDWIKCCKKVDYLIEMAISEDKILSTHEQTLHKMHLD